MSEAIHPFQLSIPSRNWATYATGCGVSAGPTAKP